MCGSKLVHYHACRHVRVVPVHCSNAPIVRKVYLFIDGEEAESAGVDPCEGWALIRIEQNCGGLEELIGFCRDCKERSGKRPLRIG